MNEKEKTNMVTLYLTEKSAAVKIETEGVDLIPILAHGFSALMQTVQATLRSEGVPQKWLIELVDGFLADSLVSLKNEFFPDSYWAKKWDVIEEMANAWLAEKTEEETNE
jgi:hypothetical protein